MKPRSKEQEKLVEWSNHFPALTERQRNYAIRHCFEGCDDFVFGIRGWFYRFKTNYVWRGSSQKSVHEAEKACSTFGTDNKELEVWHRSSKVDKAYFMILTTKGGYQAARWFLITRYIHVDWKPVVRHTIDYYFMPVGVEWMNGEGALWSVERYRCALSGYLDSWSNWGDLELKKYDFFAEHLDPMAILIQSVLPIVRRNGYKPGVSTNWYGSITLRALLTLPEFENWYKCGHYAVCNSFLHDHYMCFSQRKVTTRTDNALWQTIIKLANRKHVKFDTKEKWSDMLDYVHQLQELNMDIHNPKILFPDNFQEAHEALQRKIDKRRTQEERERIAFDHLRQAKDKAKNADFQVWMAKYVEMFKTMDIKDGALEIKPLIKFKDFKGEADWMHHCIVTYYGKPHTLLVSIMHDGVKAETAEISLKRNGEIVQSRGKYNAPSPWHEQIMALLKQSMKEFMSRYKNYYQQQKKQKAKRENEPKQTPNLPAPISFFQQNIQQLIAA